MNLLLFLQHSWADSYSQGRYIISHEHRRCCRPGLFLTFNQWTFIHTFFHLVIHSFIHRHVFIHSPVIYTFFYPFIDSFIHSISKMYHGLLLTKSWSVNWLLLDFNFIQSCRWVWSGAYPPTKHPVTSVPSRRTTSTVKSFNHATFKNSNQFSPWISATGIYSKVSRVVEKKSSRSMKCKWWSAIS